MSNKINYVLGFMFNKTEDKVLLIKKNRPNMEMMNVYNGLGGKVEIAHKTHMCEVYESPLQAMRREFREECGIEHKYWEKFCEFQANDWSMIVFRAFGNIEEAKTLSDEEIEIVEVNNLPKNLASKLSWLIPMALEKYTYYLVEEL